METKGNTMKDNQHKIEATIIEADNREDMDDIEENDGQPSEYTDMIHYETDHYKVVRSDSLWHIIRKATDTCVGKSFSRHVALAYVDQWEVAGLRDDVPW